MNSKEAVILIGHGGVPTDFPRPLMQELRRLEAERMARKQKQMSPREAELDAQIRNWPRTPATDPYQAGLENLAGKLSAVLPERVVIAYNEFCAPSVEAAAEALIAEGYGTLRLLTTMFTPGGSHSEIEIPEIVADLQARHPGIRILYAWPYRMEDVAELLALRLQQARESEKAPA
jgi:sirohydrochlorin cobaltochelatase